MICLTLCPRVIRAEKLNRELDKALQAMLPLDPQKIILFGSMSRGNLHSNSDLDLLVVWDTDLPFLKRIEAFYDVICPEVAMDIMVYTPEEITSLNLSNPFIHQALAEGRVVYEKRIPS